MLKLKKRRVMKNNASSKPIKATIMEAADQLRQLNLNAAGIDIGSREHAVAVPPDRDLHPVQIFGTFTEDLIAPLPLIIQKCLEAKLFM